MGRKSVSDFIEQLRKERSADVQDAADRLEEQGLLIEAQQAEIARLREALIIALDSMESVDGENDCSRGIKAAEAALEKKP